MGSFPSYFCIVGQDKIIKLDTHIYFCKRDKRGVEKVVAFKGIKFSDGSGIACYFF